MCHKESKNIAEVVFGLILAFLLVFQGVNNVEAKGSGGGIGTIIGQTNHVLNIHYIDMKGHEIITGHTLGPFKVNDELESTYKLETDLQGYDYVSFFYTDVQTGFTSEVMSGDILNLDEKDPANYKNDNVYERDVFLQYKVNPASIQYKFDVNYIDTQKNTIKGSYADTLTGGGSTFTPEIAAIEGYEYQGYYYENLKGEARGKGSIDKPIQEEQPVIVTDSEGKDAEALEGVYQVYAVYAKKETPVIEEYTVTYDANGGTGSVRDEHVYKAGETVTVLRADEISLDKYTFVKWNTKKDGTGISYDPKDTFTIDADITLYAQWRKTPDVSAELHEDPNGDDNGDTPTNTPAGTKSNSAKRPSYSSGGTQKAATVKTNDNNSMVGYLLAAVLASMAIAVITYVRKRSNRIK